MVSRRKDSKGRVLKNGESERKDGRYQYRYTHNGKRHTIYGLTLSELRHKENDIQENLNRRVNYLQGQMTVIEMCKYFFDTKQNLKDTTKYTYQNVFSSISKYSFSRMCVSEVTTMDVRRWCVEQTQDYKYGTIKKHFTLVKQAFQELCTDGVISRNPCQFALSSVIPNNSESKHSLTKEEVEVFLQCLKESKSSSQYFDIAFVLLNTGLRIGECLALTVKDIDFNQHTLSINKQIIEVQGVQHVSETKSKAGIRDVPIPDVVMPILRRLAKSASVSNYVLDGYTSFVFTKNEHLMLPPNIRYHFNLCVSQYNQRRSADMIALPNVTPHILRHTYCSRLVELNVNPKAIQYVMGHANIGITLETYAHPAVDWVVLEVMESQNSIDTNFDT